MMSTVKYPHLKDIEFLNKLYALRLREQYVKIILLDFNENPIKEIHGSITSGSVSVNGSAAVRRTINLSTVAAADVNDLTNIDYYISFNKKIKIEVGLKNPFPKYDDILWFPIGLYVISTANLSHNATGCTISITGKDKMSKLDGTIGGTLPAVVEFATIDEVDEQGNVIAQIHPTLYQIIVEAVHHYGEEPLDNIFIDGLHQQGNKIKQYNGSKSIFFTPDYSSFSYSLPENYAGDYHRVSSDQNIGYELTDLTYPGDKLQLNAGETVAALLDKIAKALGNFEYFYDLDGKFHFQEIKNYINTRITENDSEKETYFQTYNTGMIAQYFRDSKLITQISVNPKFDNIKNDFIVYGNINNSDGTGSPLKMHVVIDQKPDFNIVNEIKQKAESSENLPDRPVPPKKPIEPLKKDYKTDEEYKEACAKYNDALQDYSEDLEKYKKAMKIYPQELLNYRYSKIELKDFPWQEELYMQALIKKESGTTSPYYDEELIAEWRKVYNPGTMDWFVWADSDDGKYFSKAGGWFEETLRVVSYAPLTDCFGNKQPELSSPSDEPYQLNILISPWNPSFYGDTSQLTYWLDFIDLPQYSVPAIGRRTKVTSNEKISKMTWPEIPQIIFYTGDTCPATEDNYEGYQTFHLSDQTVDLFTTDDANITALDEIRNLISSHLVYNLQLSITCFPMYHLEPNTLIYIYNKAAAIDGTFQISQFTIPLGYNGTMSITATEILSKY